jgi:long-chain acyl-CoA synthetase
MNRIVERAADKPQSRTLIHHFLEVGASVFPDKIALIHEDVRATYAQINAKANQLAKWLINQGVAPGDRIALILENCLEYVISYYGGLKAGAVIAPFNTDIKSDGLRYLLGELEAKAIISSAKFENILQESDLPQFHLQALVLKSPKLKWPNQPLAVLSWDDLISDDNFPNPNLAIEGTALGSIIYTSGSTGKPKGVMLSHRNIVANVHSICQYLHLTQKDIQMAVLPFFYVMGKSLLNTHFAVGGTLVVNNKFTFPVAVIKQMVEERVTGFSGVPSTYAYLLHRSPLAKYRDKLESLRYCSQAGGHMSRQIKEELRKVLPGHTQIYIMYGATEASARLSYLEPERFADKMESIGKAIPDVQLRVLGEDGTEVPIGQIGELVASGANIMQGYWKDPEATAKALDENGYHTGDLCYQDEEGFFFLVGRKDNLLKVGGHRVSPQEIEDVLMSTGFLLEAAILGVPDELLGHRLIALLTPKSQKLTAEQIVGFCAGRLPKHQLPSEIRFVSALPKTTSGKIDRTKCYELVNS